MTKPILKWCGGKRDLVDQITGYFPDKFNDYYEPFFGGGAVFFGLDRSRYRHAYLSDANWELVNLYRCTRDCLAYVEMSLFELDPLSVTREKYNAVRWSKPDRVHAQAARTIYLNKLGFNGLYRVRKKDGQFNVPWGKKESWKPDIDGLRGASASLRQASIDHCDFMHSIQRAAEGDVVYLDPPYVPASVTASFVGYTSDGFTIDDQRRVATGFARLASIGVTVVASNSDVPLVRDLYGSITGATLVSVDVKRRINCKGSSRGPVGELLIVANSPKIIAATAAE